MKLLILTFLVCLQGVSFSAPEKSNLEFLLELTDTLVLRFRDTFYEQGTEYVLLSAGDPENGLNWLLQTRLIRSFEEISAVYIQSAVEKKGSISGQGIRVEFVPLFANITYSKYDSVSAAGEGLVERRGTISCTFVVTRPDQGRVLWNGDLECKMTDVVAESRIPSLEGELAYTQGRWSDELYRSNRWKQAILVSGVTGLIVYLFYTIRSR